MYFMERIDATYALYKKAQRINVYGGEDERPIAYWVSVNSRKTQDHWREEFANIMLDHYQELKDYVTELQGMLIDAQKLCSKQRVEIYELKEKLAAKTKD
jgi:hypothetical protein